MAELKIRFIAADDGGHRDLGALLVNANGRSTGDLSRTVRGALTRFFDSVDLAVGDLSQQLQSQRNAEALVDLSRGRSAAIQIHVYRKRRRAPEQQWGEDSQAIEKYRLCLDRVQRALQQNNLAVGPAHNPDDYEKAISDLAARANQSTKNAEELTKVLTEAALAVGLSAEVGFDSLPEQVRAALSRLADVLRTNQRLELEIRRHQEDVDNYADQINDLQTRLAALSAGAHQPTTTVHVDDTEEPEPRRTSHTGRL